MVAIDDRVEWHSTTIIRTSGIHGTGVWAERMGLVSGYVLKAPGEPVVYWAGDTILCDPVQKAISDYQPDIIITHSCGARFPDSDPILMDDEQTIALMREAPNAIIVAVHMEALDHASVTREDLRATADKNGISSKRLLIPDDGDTLEF